MLTEEQQGKLIENCEKMTRMVFELTDSLNKASQQIRDQTSTIEQLSKDNLALVAKLDAFTGKKAPGTTFSA
jgi:hypothetical protein